MKKLLSIAALAALSCAAASKDKVAPDLKQNSGNVDVVIQFAAAPADSDLDHVRGAGGVMTGRFDKSKSASFSVPAAAVQTIATMPDVTYVSPDRPLGGQLRFTTAAALLLEQNPALTPDQVKYRLMKTATRNFPSVRYTTDPATGTYRSAYDFLTVGAGYLDIHAALNNSDMPAQPAPVAAVALRDPSSGTVNLVSGASVIWGSIVIWGISAIRGSSIVWADTSPAGQSVIWGSSVVWADNLQCGLVPGEN